MTKLNFSFFIKIIIEVIKEKSLDTKKSITLLYIYCLIVNDIASIYNDKFKPVNKYVGNNKKSWINTIFNNNKFYDDLVIRINIELLNILAVELESGLIKKYLDKIMVDGIESVNDFEKYNVKIISEIKMNILEYIKNNDLRDFLKLEKNQFEPNIILDKNSILARCLIPETDFKNLTDHLISEHNKINKLNELTELLNLTTELSDEQKIINSFWVKIFNKIGIVGFWNFMLCLSFKGDYDFVFQIKSFNKLNIYLYNGVLYLEFIKNLISTTSPFYILKEHVLKPNNKSLWFIEENVELINPSPNDYPSQINMLSTIAANIVNRIIGPKTSNVFLSFNDIGLMLGDNTLYQNSELSNKSNRLSLNNFPYYFNDRKFFKNNHNLSVMTINFTDWYSILESQSICYLNLFQVFLTSHHMGRETGNTITKIIDNIYLD